MIKNALKSVLPSVIVCWLTAIISNVECSAGSGNIDTETTIVMETPSSRGQLLRSIATSSMNSNETMFSSSYDNDDPFERLERFKKIQANLQKEITERAREQKRRAREMIQKLPQPRQEDLEKVTQEEFDRMTMKQKERGLGWFGDSSSNGGGSTSAEVLLDPSQYYDKWAQAYRMLGGFIDCDHDKSNNNNHHSGDQQQQYQNMEDKTACSRWMLWASVSKRFFSVNGLFIFVLRTSKTVSFTSFFLIILSSLIFGSMSTPTTKEMNMTNTSAIALQVF